MQDPLSFTVTLDEAAVRSAVGAHVRRISFGRFFWLLILAILTPYIVALFVLNAFFWEDILPLLAFVGVAVLVLMPLTAWIAIRNTLRAPGILEPIRYTVTSAALTVQAGDSSSQLTWAHYARAYETDRFVYIILKSRQFHFIPKAQIDAPTLTSLRMLLKQAFGAKARLAD